MASGSAATTQEPARWNLKLAPPGVTGATSRHTGGKAQAPGAMADQQEAEAAMPDYGLPFEKGLEEDGSQQSGCLSLL